MRNNRRSESQESNFITSQHEFQRQQLQHGKLDIQREKTDERNSLLITQHVNEQSVPGSTVKDSKRTTDNDQQMNESLLLNNSSQNSNTNNSDNLDSVLVPFEINPFEEDEEEEVFVEDSDRDSGLHQNLYTSSSTWFPIFILVLCFVSPCLLVLMFLSFDIVGRMWSVFPFSVHLLLASVAGIASLTISSQNLSPIWSILLSAVTFASSLLDICLFGWIYPIIIGGLNSFFLTECDGSPVPEYLHYRTRTSCVVAIGYFIATSRLVLATVFCTGRLFQSSNKYSIVNGKIIVWRRNSIERTKRIVRIVLVGLTITSTIIVCWSLYSVVEYILNVESAAAQSADGPLCDPLDNTECMLPFPSYHFMKPSNTSVTGYRVNLLPHVVPPLKGRNMLVHADFLNRLDGFPTMGPIMFYMDGLKESHEMFEKNPELTPRTRLAGSAEISVSVTSKSLTLLLDVEEGKLVPHSAEIDYLDAEKPLVLVFPARPCKHNTHYALAVINATDATTGKRLLPTPGMVALMSEESIDMVRRERFQNDVIPALERAAPWFSYSVDPDSLQLLFDFPTISEESQLGPIRAVRDATMSTVSDEQWKWSNHARLNSVEDVDCQVDGTQYARTINAEIDVPWFLEGFGVGRRASFLDDEAVKEAIPSTIGTAKFRIHVPCSVMASIMDVHNTNKQISAVLEYGHGLFADRNEASFSFVRRLAEEGGFLVVAMDWRGMSKYDLLFVIKALVARPSLFQALRDNLIQGYSCKLAMLHFTKTALFSTDWLAFQNNGTQYRPSTHNLQVPQVFYGNSQGGILGAGYVALSGPTSLIDRAVLGVPGTPFALIMTRSLAFEGYDELLLFNFHNNRHVRMLIALVQMAWDPTEGSGTLAQPVIEKYPPVLIQAGLGDATVPTIAAEALARGFGAKLLPHHPREIFGLSDLSVNAYDTVESRVVFTEFLFEHEYEILPRNDVFGVDNQVHVCLREDEDVIEQIRNFVASGAVVDVCTDDNCVRSSISCF